MVEPRRRDASPPLALTGHLFRGEPPQEEGDGTPPGLGAPRAACRVVDFAGWWSRENPHEYLGDTFTIALRDRATSGSHHSWPSRRQRRFWPVVAGLFVLAVALAMFAWQQGGDGGSGGLLNAIAKAAERTRREPGGRAAMHTTVSSPDRSYTMTGGVVFDTQTGRSRVVLTMPDPNSSGSVTMQAVIDGTVMYIQLGKLGSLPGGAEWMSLDFSSFGLERTCRFPATVTHWANWSSLKRQPVACKSSGGKTCAAFRRRGTAAR